MFLLIPGTVNRKYVKNEASLLSVFFERRGAEPHAVWRRSASIVWRYVHERTSNWMHIYIYVCECMCVSLWWVGHVGSGSGQPQESLASTFPVHVFIQQMWVCCMCVHGLHVPRNQRIKIIRKEKRLNIVFVVATGQYRIDFTSTECTKSD